MTRDEINQIPFKFASHLAMEDEHSILYTAKVGVHQFAICKFTPYKDGVPNGRTITHYMVDGKVFKTKKKFYQYCETI